MRSTIQNVNLKKIVKVAQKDLTTRHLHNVGKNHFI